ncbi:MAG: hypothetical protein JRJ47_09575, partial [Deltaproteobacteria bacterium]|nr:hypothetical protein [Deltaproteobacteria bacterium]
MRKIRPFFVILLYMGLLGYVGSTTFSVAEDATDAPHLTHLSDARGPGINECHDCHDSPTPLDYDTVNWDSCDPCHRPGGAYDGVNDPDVGAKNNWMNTGSSAEATQSLIYENGTLKSGKEKW